MPTLADLQRPGDDDERRQLPLALRDARTVTTPEFAGMTFLEVEAKSALNAVRGMPFAWSINPYRGCSHACSYCLAGDTPVLMGDGSTRLVGDLRAGDQIYGTRRRGRLRRVVPTTVTDHWMVTRPAYRVRLGDGTELICSGDHRLLTDRGWRHVTATDDDGALRPYLRPGHWLVGIARWPVEGEAVGYGAATRVAAIEALGATLPMYDMTTGTGDFIAAGVVNHNCFARPTHSYLNLSPAGDFERTIVVKTNLVEVLRAELARPTWRGEQVALGTNTDPYQRCEGRYRLMPGIVRALADARTPLSILTKGTLITRDRGLLAEAAAEVELTAALTIGMLDERCWRTSEPGTPHPRARLEAVRSLNEAGVPTGVMLAPIMPDLNDDPEQLAELIDAAAAAGATHITPIVLHLRRGVRELFMPWLRRVHPELESRYDALYRSAQAASEYREQLQRFIRARREEAWRRHGRPEPPAARQDRRDMASPASTGRAHATQQLRLL